MVLPVSIVALVAYVLILSSPRTYLSVSSLMVKLEQNAEALRCRQSRQLQTNFWDVWSVAPWRGMLGLRRRE
jgi:hypothetical protein